jgi:hypothetical protein
MTSTPDDRGDRHHRTSYQQSGRQMRDAASVGTPGTAIEVCGERRTPEDREVEQPRQPVTKH